MFLGMQKELVGVLFPHKLISALLAGSGHSKARALRASSKSMQTSTRDVDADPSLAGNLALTCPYSNLPSSIPLPTIPSETWLAHAARVREPHLNPTGSYELSATRLVLKGIFLGA